jgi:hypothetical protein
MEKGDPVNLSDLLKITQWLTRSFAGPGLDMKHSDISDCN